MNQIARRKLAARLVALTWPLLLGGLCASTAQAAMFSTDDFNIYGDFRFRLEHDWDSVRTDGVTKRDDRTRAEARADIFDYIERFHNRRKRRQLDRLNQHRLAFIKPSVVPG